MKSGATKINCLCSTPRQRGIESISTQPAHHGAHQDGVLPENAGLFLRHICKVAGIERKQLAYLMRVSDTIVDRWFSGERSDPLDRAREFCAKLTAVKRADLIPHVLAWIAGQDFDGRVLTPDENAALKKLMGVQS